MNVCSLAVLTHKTAFLLTLASAKRNSEVWAFSADVVFGHDKQSATLRFLPGFIAKTQKPDRPDTALSPVTIPALAYSEAKSEDIPHLTSQNVQARELRAIATSLAFHQHHLLKQVMEAACWRVDSTFASFYLRDLTPAHLHELGPLIVDNRSSLTDEVRKPL